MPNVTAKSGGMSWCSGFVRDVRMCWCPGFVRDVRMWGVLALLGM